MKNKKKDVIKKIRGLVGIFSFTIIVLFANNILSADEKQYVGDGVTVSIMLSQDNICVTDAEPIVTLEMDIEIQGVNAEVSDIQAIFMNENFGICTQGGSYVDGIQHTFVGLSVTDASGYYLLHELYFTIDGERVYVKNLPEVGFTFENNITDKTGPNIISVEIDKQGQKVEDEEITFVVYADDETGLQEWGSLSIRSSQMEYYENVSLQQVEEGKYVGTIDVSELYPTRWFVEGIFILDTLGNPCEYHQMEAEADKFFYVCENGEFIQKAYEGIQIRFYPLGRDIVFFTKDIIPGTTYGELLGNEYVQLPDDKKLGKFLGWRDGYGSEELITKDSIVKVSFSGQEIPLNPVYEKKEVTVRYLYLNEKGQTEFINETILVDYDATYGDILADARKPISNEKYPFSQWEIEGWNEEDGEPDEVVVHQSGVYLIAKYEELPIRVRLIYLDQNGELVFYDKVQKYPYGTTYRDIFNRNTEKIEGKILGWTEKFGVVWTAEINIYELDLFCYARYEDKQIINYHCDYYSQSNENTEKLYKERYENWIVIDKLDQYETNLEGIVNAMVEEQNKIHHNNRLTFECFKGLRSVDGDGDGYTDTYYMESVYKEHLVCFENTDDSWSMVVEPGQYIKLDTKYKGKEICWYSSWDEKTYYGGYIIPQNMKGKDRLQLSMETNTENAILVTEPVKPEEPTEPVEPVEPTEPIEPTEPAEPTEPDFDGSEEREDDGDKIIVKLEDNEISNIIEQIGTVMKEESVSQSETPQIVVDMKKEDGNIATEVPKEILESIKGQTVEVVLDMGNYSWIIMGDDVSGEELKSINLEVSFRNDIVPQEIIQTVVKDGEVHQISLSHNGEFGFKAKLQINVGTGNGGKYGNLYYYNNGKLDFMNAGKVDENGNVALEFSHASDYILVISNTEMVKNNNIDSRLFLIVPLLVFIVVGGAVAVKKCKKI